MSRNTINSINSSEQRKENCHSSMDAARLLNYSLDAFYSTAKMKMYTDLSNCLHSGSDPKSSASMGQRISLSILNMDM